MGYLDKMRFRKTWEIAPYDRIHMEGKTPGYNRNNEKKNWKEEWEETDEEEGDKK